MNAVRRTRVVGWRGKLVASWGGRRGSQRGRGIAAHMYCPLFFFYKLLG